MIHSECQLVTGRKLRELDGLASRATLSARRVDSLQLAGPFFFGGDMTVNVKGYPVQIDDEDYGLVVNGGWCLCWNGRHTHLYFVRIRNKERQWLHHAITGIPNKTQLDHADGDTLNNRKANLRLASCSQNAFNRKTINKRGVKGITWHKGSKKWQSQIKVEGRSIYLGLFESIEDAGKAYAMAAFKYAGEFSRW